VARMQLDGLDTFRVEFGLTVSGRCDGKTAQSVPDAGLLLPPWVAEREVNVASLPVGGGNSFDVRLNGSLVQLTAPKGAKKGAAAVCQAPAHLDVGGMHFSSMTTAPPGFTVVKSCPMIYVIGPYCVANAVSSTSQKAAIDKAQSEALAEAANLGCNALLGVSLNFSRTSLHGDKIGYSATITGTPCVVVPNQHTAAVPSAAPEVPVVLAEVVFPDASATEVSATEVEPAPASALSGAETIEAKRAALAAVKAKRAALEAAMPRQ